MRFKWAGGLVLAGLFLLIAGCATPIVPVGYSAPAVVSLSSTPFYAQQRLQCGPASMAMALAASGVEVTPDELTPQLFLPSRRGSIQAEMLAVASAYDRMGLELNGADALLESLGDFIPVIVLLDQLPGRGHAWHYAVVVGYDAPRGQLVVHTGQDSSRNVRWDRFDRQWAESGRWGMTVTLPEQLPPFANSESVMLAALRLQRLGRLQASSEAFLAAKKRFPAVPETWIAVANSQLQAGRSVAAQQTLLRALELHPDNPVILNNLASLLVEFGCASPAVSLAERALAVAGRHREAVNATLLEARRAAAAVSSVDERAGSERSRCALQDGHR